MKETNENGPSREPGGEDLMNKRQVAKMLGKSERTIDNWRKDLGLPSYKVEHSVYFKKGEVLAFMEQFSGNGGGVMRASPS
jgi:predicted DNA-binding transcriptional regulator AlpA